MNSNNQHRKNSNLVGPIGYCAAMISRRRWLFLAVVLAAGAATLFLAAQQQPVYRSRATLLVSADGPGAKPAIGNQVELLRSYAVARRACAGLSADARAQLGTGDPARQLQRAVTVRAVGRTDVIAVAAEAVDPGLARAIADACVDAGRAIDLNHGRARVGAVRGYVRTRLDSVRARLELAESELAEYRANTGRNDVNGSTRGTVNRQARVLSLFEQARAERSDVEQELGLLHTRVESRGYAVTGPAVDELRDELDRLEVERVSLVVQGDDGSSLRIQAVYDRIGGVARRIEDAIAGSGPARAPGAVRALFNRIAELEPERERLCAAEGALGHLVESGETELGRLPRGERSLARLVRAVEVDRRLELLLAQRYEETGIEEAGLLPAVGIIDRPADGVKVAPDLVAGLAFALLLGLLLAVAVVSAVDYFDTTLRRADDLDRRGFHLLTSVPPGERPGAAPFREIARGLQLTAGSRPAAIVVSSPGRAEGRSFVAANLALTLARSGRRCLLVDADLHQPSQHLALGRARQPGLTDVITLGVPLDQAVGRSEAGLDVLPAGTETPSPADFLGSPLFRDFLAGVERQYDVVLIDAPPALEFDDALTVGTLCDGVVLVARLGKTDWRRLDEARRFVARAGVANLGAVANELRGERRRGAKRRRAPAVCPEGQPVPA